MTGCRKAHVVAIGVAGICFMGSAVRAEETHDEYTTTATSIEKSDSAVWLNRTSGSPDKVAWKSGSVLTLTQAFSSFGVWFPLSAYGFLIETDGSINYTGSCLLSLGSGGVTFTKAGNVAMGYYFQDAMVKLMADQAWKGPDTAGSKAVFAIGYANYYNKGYNRSYAIADTSVHGLTIQGNLAVMLYSDKNNLSGVDVTVQSPAEIVLPKVTTGSGSATCSTEGRLNARTLVLSGDGVRARFGSRSPVTERHMKNTPETVPEISSRTLAPVVTLHDGADLVASNTVFALAKLNVTGSGVSTISGSKIVFTNAVTELAVDSGATLAFDADDLVVSNGALKVTGGGALAFVRQPLWRDLQSLVVDSGATLSFGACIVSTPISGGGKIVVTLNEGEEAYLRDVTGFTGPIEVKGGVLRLNTVPEGGVTTSDGGSVAYPGTRDGWVFDAPVEDATIEVGPGETLNVAGDGLTAATTVLMKGGVLKVHADAVVSAAILQSVSSEYRIAGDVRATFAGAWRLATADANTVNRADVFGGDVRVTGGVFAEGVKDQFLLDSGEIRLSGTSGYFYGDFGTKSGMTASYWEFSVPYAAKTDAKNTSGVGFYFYNDKSTVRMTAVISAGGALRFEGNRCWYGYSGNTVEIRGGVLSDASWGQSSFGGKGTIRLVDGTYEMRRTPWMSDGSAVDWQGGTIAVKDVAQLKNRSLFEKGYVNVSGTNCLLDLSALSKATSVTNSISNGGVPCAWSLKAGCKLAVKGPGKMVFVNLANTGGSLELDENANVLFPTRTTALDLKEMVVNGTNCTIAIGSATVTPTIETLRIGADGLWREGLLSAFGNPAVTNMAFDDGAIWQADGTPLAVSGTLSFGDSVRYWFLPEARGTVAHAEGGITGNPVWQKFMGGKREFTFTGCDLVATGFGVMLMLR